jgi:predicted nucleic acid-binding protein
MSYKTQPTKPRPLSEDEKKAQVERFLAQKRESFSINILCNLCRVTKKADLDLVKKSVEMADALIMELYPVPEDSQTETQTES